SRAGRRRRLGGVARLRRSTEGRVGGADVRSSAGQRGNLRPRLRRPPQPLHQPAAGVPGGRGVVLNELNPAPSAVVFVLDGTLIDSAPDITDALNIALTAHSLDRLDVEQVRPLLGLGARELVAQAVTIAGGQEPDVEGVLADSAAAYEAKPVEATTVNADAIPALRRLRAAGVKIGVCTNKRTHMARAVLAGTGL